MLELAGATIDDTVKPAIEWIGGKPVQKLMPTAFHAFVQSAFLRLLYEWAKVATDGRGRVGTEWRFKIPANVYDTLSVVPDVAFVADLTLQPPSERQYPAVPPDIVVEVRSPGDVTAELVKKRDFYRWWGVKLVITADPECRTIETQERDEPVSYLSEDQTLTSRAFPLSRFRCARSSPTSTVSSKSGKASPRHPELVEGRYSARHAPAERRQINR